MTCASVSTFAWHQAEEDAHETLAPQGNDRSRREPLLNTKRDEAMNVPTPLRQNTLVLIVDDERAIADVLANVVEYFGYPTLIAYTGKQALDLVHQCWPAVVISDVLMPLIDGCTLVAALRAEAAAWDLPLPALVLMTAASPRAARAAQVDAVVAKPFDITTIETLLQHFLREAS